MANNLKLRLFQMNGQIIDKMNVFGYSRATTNQIRFMHWLLGEFYQSSIFGRGITWGLILFNVASFLIILAFSSSYILLSSIREYSQIMFIVELMALTIYCIILLPAITCVNREHTLKSFKIFDQELHDFTPASKTSSSRNKLIAEGGRYNRVILAQLVFSTFSFVLLYFDLIHNYSSEKLRNSEFYLYPVHCEWVENLTTFSILLLVQIVSVFPIACVVFLFPIFSLTLVSKFCQQFQLLRDSLDYQSKLFHRRFENVLMSEQSLSNTADFQDILIQNAYSAAKCHQKLLGGINHLKFYVEQVMSASTVLFFFVEVVLVFITIYANEKSFIRKIKFICYVSGISTTVFINCVVGKEFMEMGEMFNDTVYDLPWYYLSPSRRKSVCLLLHHAQIPIEFKALKIFPKSMGFLLKLCRYVYSFVNVLRFTFAVRHT